MMRRLGKWVFPRDKRSARNRKMRILMVTVVGGLLASTLIALGYIWVYNSDRF